jgi:uncharacterized protein
MSIHSHVHFCTAIVIALVGVQAALAQERPDPQLLAYINGIKAIDNHSHALPVVPPARLDVPVPDPIGTSAAFYSVRQREDNPEWIAAWRSLYGYAEEDATAAHLQDALSRKRARIREQATSYPAWTLDRIGIDVMLINAPQLGAGQAAPRFRWVPYADGFLFPFPTQDVAGTQLQQRREQAGIPPDLPAWPQYLDRISDQLRRWKDAKAVAIKFAVTYYRPIDFHTVSEADARRVYESYLLDQRTQRDYLTADYRALQDFLFRHIARQAGMIGLPVHLHTGEGAGPVFPTSGSNPLLLEAVLNDFSLSRTTFVLVHGGFPFDRAVTSLIQKPNVFTDISGQTFFRSADDLSETLRLWLSAFPEKVMFGTDAFANTWLRGWEEMAWIATRTGRQALALALTAMMNSGEIMRPRAEAIARMVLRDTAVRLYQLDPMR